MIALFYLHAISTEEDEMESITYRFLYAAIYV